MDLAITPEDASLRDEACAWLDGWLPDDYGRSFGDYRLDLEFRREYQRAAFEEGWLAPAWERELGGRAVGAEAELWIKLSFARRRAPKLPNVAGTGVVAPALLAHGDQSQRDHVVPLMRGDEWWCLGMSEPEAGSDLASLRTTARLADGRYVINGQKIWTSNAREASRCLLFTRTNPELERHRGISGLIVPMASPGITVRPISKIGAGDEEFCEVFFEDVEVPESAVVGRVDDGWRVAMSSLQHERDMIWIMNLVEIERALDITETLLADGAPPDATLELERMHADADAIWLTGLRGLANRLASRTDREVPLLKLFATEAAQRAFLLAARAAGENAPLLGADAPFDGEIPLGEIEALAATIYGGTSEIQRNLIGEQVLGLPRR
jgi:alkylation response protein AidB-like acyl-CoA dehydrogenase